ncbi:MAG TPA: glycerophosphodiester phosphodiesterase family protein [Pyrinomonadaceae bacterium]|nr:glycerophosphodiester phosphodiesterase family protein [Pyrinomonadaceae bacterium]
MISTPLIIGHRGASAVTPENTLAAFSQALEDGADGIEFDVRLSRDGVPVVIHDATLKRTANLDRLVADLDASELQQCDVSSWFKPAKHEQRHTETVPTLAQVFELFQRTNFLFCLEMKSEAPDATPLVQAVVDEIHRAKVAKRVVVSSFDLMAVAIVKQIDPTIRTAALFEPKLSRPLSTIRRLKLVDLAIEHGADELALHHSLCSARVVQKAAQFGLPVVVWTVDDVKWIKRGQRLGLKALITNDPAVMIRHARALVKTTAITAR